MDTVFPGVPGPKTERRVDLLWGGVRACKWRMTRAYSGQDPAPLPPSVPSLDIYLCFFQELTRNRRPKRGEGLSKALARDPAPVSSMRGDIRTSRQTVNRALSPSRAPLPYQPAPLSQIGWQCFHWPSLASTWLGKVGERLASFGAASRDSDRRAPRDWG